MPPRKDQKIYTKPTNSKSKPKNVPRRQLVDEHFTTPLQHFAQTSSSSQQAPADNLDTWISSCTPDFLQQMKSAWEKSSSSNTQSSSQSTQISQTHATLPEESYRQTQQEYVQSQTQFYCQPPSAYDSPQPNVRRNRYEEENEVEDETAEKKRNYEKPEDVLLCQVVSNLSDKPREERGYKFWRTITDNFNKDNYIFRPKSSLTNRWSKLKRVAGFWKSACDRVDSNHHSGFDEEMIMKLKKQRYCALAGEKEFSYDHIMEHLCNFSKYNWTTSKIPSFNDDDEARRTPGSQGSGKRSYNTMNEDSGEEEADEVEVCSPKKKTVEFSSSYATTRRPEGIKKTKAREKAAREASGHFQSMDAEFNRRIAVEQEREAERNALVAQKLALQKEDQDRKRMEAEMKIMQIALDTSKTDEDFVNAQAIRTRFFQKWGNF